MEITDVQISLFNDFKIKAFVTVTLDHVLVIHGIKIIQHSGRYFIAMPSRKQKNGSFRDVAHPISSEFRTQLEKIVIERYWKVVREKSISVSV